MIQSSYHSELYYNFLYASNLEINRESPFHHPCSLILIADPSAFYTFLIFLNTINLNFLHLVTISLPTIFYTYLSLPSLMKKSMIMELQKEGESND
jgi:hypothetical protein